MLSPLIQQTAAALRCTVNGLSEPIRRNGVELFPALAYFTIDDAASPAHGATFALKLPDLTTATLEKSFHETTDSFANR